MEMLVFSADWGVCMSRKQNIILIFPKLTFVGYVCNPASGTQNQFTGVGFSPHRLLPNVVGVIWAGGAHQETGKSERVFSVRNPLNGRWNIAKMHQRL